MIAPAYYLLKVIFCSGILYGYYHLALRDKVFHQWNRFYLLGAILVSTLLPLLTIQVDAPQAGSKVVTALQVVNGADEFMKEAHQSGTSIPLQTLALVAYGAGALAVFFVFIRALQAIRVMIRRNKGVNMDDFVFLNTGEPGTPFSFFRFLLWNREISLDTENGQRILEHELVHIREKHSHDKLFIQLILVPFWINPFFWLIRREITMIHEFIADRRSVEQGDAAALAKLLLETSYPGYAPLLTNTFFKTSIKRRLAMINKQNKPGLNYISRIMMIPLLTILLFAFAVKARSLRINDAVAATVKLDKTVTVVIDAGHGGDDAGASANGFNEKDITLALAKKVMALNQNKNINIVLSRPEDQLISPRDRAIAMKKISPDLMISLHVNSASSADSSGMVAYIDDENSFAANNRRLASILVNNMDGVYPADNQIKKRIKSIHILKQSTWPAALLECGYMTNPKDLNFVTNQANQEKIARQVLRSIEDYFNANVVLAERATVTDSVPKNKQVKNVTLTYSDGSKETLTPEEYKKRMSGNAAKPTSDTIKLTGIQLVQVKSSSTEGGPTYFIDGKAASKQEVDALPVSSIATMNVSKKEGDQGRVDIITKTGTAINGTVNGTMQVNTGTKDSMRIVINGTIGEKNAVTVNGDPSKPKPLMIVDGKEMPEGNMKDIDPNTIESINILKGEAAEAIYKEKGKNGVVVITLKAKR